MNLKNKLLNDFKMFFKFKKTVVQKYFKKNNNHASYFTIDNYFYQVNI